MAINANRLVSITPRTIRGGSADLETNGLVLTESEKISANEPALKFTTASAVAQYFGAESPEANFATQYFTGVNNQQKAIECLFVARRIREDASGWVKGHPTATLADLKKITNGSITVSVKGIEKEAVDIDLSEKNSLSEAFEEIAGAIGGVAASYEADTNTLTLTTTEKGKDATISFATKATTGTDLSEILGLTESAGAVLSQGSPALSVSKNMDKVATVSRNWVGFTTLYETDEEEAVALATWADIDDDYVYFDWTTNKNVKDAEANKSTKPAKLKEFNCVATMYGDAQDVAFLLAVGASIDWNANQGIKTWFAKTTSGLNPNVLENEEAQALDDLRCNYLGQFACRNSDFKLLNRGVLTGEQYGFIDVLYGMIWFKAKIQRSCMDGLASVNRSPYNDAGYALVEAWLLDPITSAKKNGVIDTGVALSQSQKAQIMQETSEDISQVLFTKGYWYKISDPEANVRAQRGSPDISLYYTYGGAIQRIAMPLTALL